jgi:hypothetical protein
VLRALPVADSLAPEGERVAMERTCVAGEEWEWDGVRLRLLHPTAYFPFPGNEASCVLRIEGPHGAALLTGDIGHGVERILARRDRDALQADVVMVGHHGSRGSSDPVFVAATGARHALVSAGPEAASTIRIRRWSRAGARPARGCTTPPMPEHCGPGSAPPASRSPAGVPPTGGCGTPCAGSAAVLGYPVRRTERGPRAGGQACWNW